MTRKRARLPTLGPRLASIRARLKPPSRSPSAARRTRGRRLMMLRQLAIAERGPLCERCRKLKRPHELQLHHRNEGGLAGADVDPFASDLTWRDAAMLICLDCHDAEHGVRTIGPDGWPT